MHYPKLRELKEAIKALIKGPYTSRFPYEPHKPYEGFRGKPEFNEKYCMGCAACSQVCPSNAITFEDIVKDGSAARALTYKTEMCIFCGQCQANCPVEKGIVLSSEFDLATTEKRQDLKQTIEKELVLCECCGEIIAPYDQILWVAKRLGPLTFSNASLMLFYLGQVSSAKDACRKTAPVHKTELRRQDRVRVLCPKCRREAVIKS